MIHLECIDFNDVFLQVNRLYLLNPELVEFIDIEKGYIKDIIVNCKSMDINLDISKLGYRMNKWKHLVNHYLSESEIFKFQEKLQNTTSLTASFYFKDDKPHKDTCLLGLVIGRKKRSEEWSSLSVVYRVCECERKLAVDLILINKLLSEYFQIEPKEISLYFSHCYCNADLMNGVYDLFGVKREELDLNSRFTKYIQNSYNRRFLPDSPISLHTATRNLQKLSRGELNLKPVPVEKLNIKEVIER